MRAQLTADVAHASVWRELINKEVARDLSAAEAALASRERATSEDKSHGCPIHDGSIVMGGVECAP